MNKSKGLLSIIFSISALFSFGQKHQVAVKSQLKEAKVFLSGAQLTNFANANISGGVTELIFENLPSDIDENSIQVKGEGDFTILSVARKMNYLNRENKPKEIKMVEDSLERVQIKASNLQSIINAYNYEEKMIVSNQVIGGNNVGVSAVELQKVADFFRSRLTEIANKRQDSQAKQKKLNEEIAKLNNQLTELNNNKNRTTSDVVVTITAKSAQQAKFTLDYFTHNVSWSPFYEIKANDSNSPLKVTAKANVYQNTGIDWEDIKLILSTGSPTVNSTKPVLYPWSLHFYDPNRYENATYRGGRVNMQKNMIVGDAQPAEALTEVLTSAQSSADYTTVVESQTNNIFEISIPYDIPSDGDVHAVEIQNFSLNASYAYYSAPKLDGDAFLVAKATGWDQSLLLSGSANVFFEGTFVGNTYIDAQNIGDTVDLSLGRDKNVVVKRTRVKEFAEKKFIGGAKKEQYVYDINVRNKKKQEIDITIEDQVPLSTHEDIKVELTESLGANYNKETGKLAWKTKIAGGTDKKVKFGYSVQYPKDKKILGL